MANYWKVGSRWSSDGSKNSLMRIFRRNSIVFIGQKNRLETFGSIQIGDYLAITDGVTIYAVAKVLEDPQPLSKMIDNGMVRFKETDFIDNRLAIDEFKDCGSWNVQPMGVRVHWVDCDPLRYDRGTLQHINKNSIRSFVDNSYKMGSTTEFDIQSATYTLCQSSDTKKKSIINESNYFNIPIYQREYSWGEEQVKRFVRDIFSGYRLGQEPMFIGTMQISAPKYVDFNEVEYDVIDGQQRLSTLFCILKYMGLRYPTNERLLKMRYDWLDTRVNNGKENLLMQELKAIKAMSQIYTNCSVENRYIENVRIIDGLFDEQLRDENDNLEELPDVDSFLDYLTQKLIFVVIETHSGLSKTIRIFNTINTAGLDLNGDDLFKVRLFEYLKDVQHENDNAFDEISKFYGEIKDINSNWKAKKHDDNLVSIHEVRTIYKDFLISRHQLNSSAYDMGTDTFFEHLFDHLLNVQEYKELGENVKKVVMSLDDLRIVLKIEKEWNEFTHIFDTIDNFLNWKMLSMSRYGKYRRIAYMVMLADYANPARLLLANRMLGVISRIAYCESIRYSKVVTNTSSSFKDVYQLLYKNCDDAYNNAYIKALDYLKCVSDRVEDCIKKPIFEQGKCHRTWGNLICVLSECLTAINVYPSMTVREMREMLNHTYDFEHIHATNDKSITNIDSNLQNGIGNLMLLEYDINRSIGNLPFEEKINRKSGKICYKNSVFVTPSQIMLNSEWNQKEMEKRREEETKKIVVFLNCFN